MDAMDVNWCLTCNRHIDSDASAPYCSRQCFASDKPSSSSAYVTPSPRHLEYDTAPESISDCDDFDEESRYDSTAQSSEGSKWIGKGDAGIEAWAREVTPGPPASVVDAPFDTANLRPPKLLLPHRRPVPPTLCMSKTTSAPPEPSKPILTPQQSLSTQCGDASTASYTTPSSSMSLATPVSDDVFMLPSARTQKPGLIGALAAHFRSWTAHPSKGLPQTETITPDGRCDMTVQSGFRRSLSPYVPDDRSYFSEVKSGEDEEPYIVWPTTMTWFEKMQRDAQQQQAQRSRSRDAQRIDHPAPHTRGRRSLRVPS